MAERQALVERLARYTGLSKTYTEKANLSVRAEDFRKELLREENRSAGRSDSRFKGIDASGISQTPDYDPSEAAVRPPFTAAFNNYVRIDLNYESDLPYYILGGLFRTWQWGSAAEGYPDVSPDLRSAFVRNKYMKVLVLEGYYDLATPYDAVTYTLEHMGLDPSLRPNVSVERYESGHMIYIDGPSLAKMKRDVSAFISSALH
jgi:carboxypeptidase C (cathepsin A)